MKTLMVSLFTATMLTACASTEEFCPADNVVTWGSDSNAQESGVIEHVNIIKGQE